MFREQLKFTDKDNYILKGCVTSPSYNHFTFYINRLKIKDNFGELELNKNYYYDDDQYNGNFQLFDTNDLFDIFNRNIFPYLLVYEKI